MKTGLAVFIIVTFITAMAACGKKTAPVLPEDVPPSKQERSKER